MKLLNLGCGTRFHYDWVNVDFASQNSKVNSFNLLNGIPFADNKFDVVYHSHLLEHFSKTDGFNFIKECYRVLKPGGIIRIAVPDLEIIAKEYLQNLGRAINNESAAESNYDWIMLEMYDQTVRNSSGGEMAKYLFRIEIPNKEYVFNRIGTEGKTLYENFLLSVKNDGNRINNIQVKKKIGKLTKHIKQIFLHIFFRNELKALETGRFRLSGEVHQWMYDRYSLGLLLTGSGFRSIKVVSAFESRIPEWNNYELDAKNGIVFKPDSLFMEASKTL